MKKLAIAIVLLGSLIGSPVHAKTFVGVLWPLFGPLPAIGLVELVAELRRMPDVEVSTYLHQSWPTLVDDIGRQPAGTHIVVVGYSLGANNSILVANNAKYLDLIVALQPSMLTSDDPPLSGKVGRVIEIYNPNPWMTFGGMGSKKLVGENIEYIANNDSHPGAQFNSQFHELVKTEIAKFVEKDRVEAARAETPRRRSVAQVTRSSKFASVEDAKQRQSDSTSKDRSKVARVEVLSKSLEQTKVEHGADEHRTQQVIASTDFIDKISSSVDSGDLLVQRQLTVGDLNDYAKRTYSRSSSIDLMASASDQAKMNR